LIFATGYNVAMMRATHPVWSQVSTGEVPEPQRFDYWRHSCVSYTSPRAIDPAVRTVIQARRSGVDSASGVGFKRHDARFGGAVQLERTAERCRRDGADNFFLLCAIEPLAHLAYDDQVGPVRPREAVLFDMARPWRGVTTSMVYFAIELERRHVASVRPRSIERLTGKALTLEPGLSHLLYGHADALSRSGNLLSAPELEASLSFLRDIAIEILCRGAPHEDEAALSGRRVVEAAKRQIMSRLDDPMLDVASIAEALGLSRTSLYRAFRGETSGIATQIMAARLERAHQLLMRDPARPIGDVAFACGFDSPRTFNRAFRQHFGRSPTELRSAAK
jgi:AraC-like DNA-binding protein